MQPQYFHRKVIGHRLQLSVPAWEIHGKDMQAGGGEFGETYVPVESSSPLIAEPNKQMQSR